jgi:hypothetical protein
LSSTKRQQRKFFVGLGYVLVAAGVWKIYRHKEMLGVTFFAIASFLLALEFFFNAAAGFLFRRWMAFAHLLGTINTTAIVTLVYFVLLTPIGMVARKKTQRDTQALRNRKSAWTSLGREDFDKQRYMSPY